MQIFGGTSCTMRMKCEEATDGEGSGQTTWSTCGELANSGVEQNNLQRGRQNKNWQTGPRGIYTFIHKRRWRTVVTWGKKKRAEMRRGEFFSAEQMREWGKETWARERRAGWWFSLKLAGAAVCSHSHLHGSQLDGGDVGGVHHGLRPVGRVRQQALPLLRQAGELLLARVEARVHAVLEVGRSRDLQPLLLLPEHAAKAVETWGRKVQKNRRQLPSRFHGEKEEDNRLKYTSVNILDV